MLKSINAFCSFSVSDIQKAREFYGQTLGLEVSDIKGMDGLLNIHLSDNKDVMVYAKPDHAPATFTILNFPVESVEATVEELKNKGVKFEVYNQEDLKTDEKGISHSDGRGPTIAWFKDPSGNFLSVMEMDNLNRN